MDRPGAQTIDFDPSLFEEQAFTPLEETEADAPQARVESQADIIEVPAQTIVRTDPLLIGAFNAYYQGCTCGTSYENNCAHYLSNAFKRQHWPVEFPANAAKCPHGRMIRAKEFLNWFRSTFNPQFRQNHNGITSGYWLVYQEAANGQGHVCIHKHQGGFAYRGTTDLPNWPVQWHYFY
jgi:hypothetical protein